MMFILVFRLINMVRNDRDTLAAAGSFQTMIQKKLRDWMTDHVDAHVSYDPDVESLGNY